MKHYEKTPKIGKDYQRGYDEGRKDINESLRLKLEDAREDAKDALGAQKRCKELGTELEAMKEKERHIYFQLVESAQRKEKQLAKELSAFKKELTAFKKASHSADQLLLLIKKLL